MRNKKERIKILIVDDSFFMRKLLYELLDTEDEIEVVGEARDGEDAIKMVSELKPDVVTMDYNMPKMNGEEAVKKILKNTSHSPAIIMLSAHTKKGAELTLNCLRSGAIDFILKPSDELSLNIKVIKNEIINKIKIAANSTRTKERKKKPNVTLKSKAIRKKIKLKLVIIGSSTGGPPVLEDILTALPYKFNTSILIVQHMPKQFTKFLAMRLNKLSPLIIKEAEEGDEIKKGEILIAPGGYHTVIKEKEGNYQKKVIHLSEGPKVNNLKPSIDVTMKSAVKYYPSELVGIILTGMGEDGLEGMRSIKKASGYTIVQKLETTAVDSMPKSVIKAKLADEILHPHEIPDRIMELNQ